MASIPELTRLLAAIHPYVAGRPRPAARRLNEAHKLLGEVVNVLAEMRRGLLGSGRRPSGQL